MITSHIPLKNREIQTKTRRIVSVQDHHILQSHKRVFQSRNCFSVSQTRPRVTNITPLNSARFQINSTINTRKDGTLKQESKWRFITSKIDSPWNTIKLKHLEEINKTMRNKQREYYEKELRSLKMEHLDRTLSDQDTNLTFQYKVNIDEDSDSSASSESIELSKNVRFDTKETKGTISNTVYTKQPSSCMSKMHIKAKKSNSKVPLPSREIAVSLMGEARANTLFDRLRKRCGSKLQKIRRNNKISQNTENRVSFIVKSTLAKAMRKGREMK